MKMLAEERRFQIREILSAQRSVSAAELEDKLGVTAATIRRDLGDPGERGRAGSLAWRGGLAHVEHQFPASVRGAAKDQPGRGR